MSWAGIVCVGVVLQLMHSSERVPCKIHLGKMGSCVSSLRLRITTIISPTFHYFFIFQKKKRNKLVNKPFSIGVSIACNFNYKNISLFSLCFLFPNICIASIGFVKSTEHCGLCRSYTNMWLPKSFCCSFLGFSYTHPNCCKFVDC